MRKLLLVTPAGRIAREVDKNEVAVLRARRANETWYQSAAEAWDLLTSESKNSKIRKDLTHRVAPFLYGVWSPAAQNHHYGDYIKPPDWLFDAYYTGPSTANTTKQLNFLKSVKSSILVLAGAEDCIAGTKPAHLAATTYNTAQLEILPGAGHYPWVDTPEHFRNLIREFLNKDR